MKFPEYSLSVPWSATCKSTEGMQRKRDMYGKNERNVFENRRCKHEWKYLPNSNAQWIKSEGLSSNEVRELHSATCCVCAWSILPYYLSNNISFCLSTKPVAYINITRKNTLHDSSHTWIIKFPAYATKF